MGRNDQRGVAAHTVVKCMETIHAAAGDQDIMRYIARLLMYVFHTRGRPPCMFFIS